MKKSLVCPLKIPDENNTRSLCPSYSCKRSLSLPCVYCKANGWDNIENGELLLQASVEFDVLITVDSNMRYQQNAHLPLSVIALRVYDNRYKALIPLLPEINDILSSLERNKMYEIGPLPVENNGFQKIKK